MKNEENLFPSYGEFKGNAKLNEALTISRLDFKFEDDSDGNSKQLTKLAKTELKNFKILIDPIVVVDVDALEKDYDCDIELVFSNGETISLQMNGGGPTSNWKCFIVTKDNVQVPISNKKVDDVYEDMGTDFDYNIQLALEIYKRYKAGKIK